MKEGERKLKSHMKTHTNENSSLRCDVCEYRFRSQIYLIQHLEIAHKRWLNFQVASTWLILISLAKNKNLCTIYMALEHIQIGTHWLDLEPSLSYLYLGHFWGFSNFWQVFNFQNFLLWIQETKSMESSMLWKLKVGLSQIQRLLRDIL